MFHPTFTAVAKALVGGVCLLLTAGQVRSESLSVIPRPVEQSRQAGEFLLSAETPIRYEAQLDSEANQLSEHIRQATGLTLPLESLPEGKASQDETPSIQLAFVEDATLGDEGYRLQVSPERVAIIGNDADGVYWGMQSLLQLIVHSKESRLPACEIKDKPRFSWRGVMLDVGRYMYEVEDIQQLIDWMAIHKLNILHWHLTEDQGWRIEIKKYPKLTSIGAWREESPLPDNRYKGDGTPYGGFYSQEDVRQLVDYASGRHITIVPEIDMPGHMAAAIAAYPELGNDDIPNYDPKVASSWGVQPFLLSPKEETFQWIDDVLGEVCDLFPSKYIHIGGDEALKDQWKESVFAQSVIKREGLRDEHELQSWFIKRVEKILERKRRQLVGWDEIREGGLSPGATVMAWQNWETAEESAREGHDVIMAPRSHTYFDYYQSSPKLELAKGPDFEAIGGYLPLAKVYDFDPMPHALSSTKYASHVLGCQAQIWSEHMRAWEQVQYMTFPRLSAFAESSWSSPKNKDFDNFRERLRPMLVCYEIAGINYYDPFSKITVASKEGAKVTSTMSGHGESVPELAYDGDWQTYFWTSQAPGLDDRFVLTFDSAMSDSYVKVYTGCAGLGSRVRQWGGPQYFLEHGVLEASTDGSDWVEVAVFNNGKAEGQLPKNCTRVCIRPTKTHESGKLVIHEIQIITK